MRTLSLSIVFAACVNLPLPDGGMPPPDAGPTTDAGSEPDGGFRPDAGRPPDGGLLPDGGPLPTAHCPGQSFNSSLVTYYGPVDLPASTDDPRCTLVTSGANTVCRIALRGILHQPANLPPGTTLPTIIYNHGSETGFDAQAAYCKFAIAVVPLGYQVFVPFRRGHGEDCALTNGVCPGKSSGLYIADQAMLCTMMPSLPYCPASCMGKGASCYTAEIFEQQLSDVADGIAYMKGRPETDATRLAIAGYSYGGIMTIASNARMFGQQCAVPMAPGSLSYGNAYLRAKLIDYAAKAKAPAYYLDAEFDRHNVEVPELAWAHSRREGIDGGPGLTDDDHGAAVQWAIFTFKDPPPSADGGGPDYEALHSQFAGSLLYAPAMIDFLERYGVRP